VRVGTCRSDRPLASLVIAETVLAEDGTSRALGAAGELAADPELLAALVAAGNGAVSGRVLTTDLYYGAAPDAGALAADLTSGAVFAVAARHGAAAACVLAVSERGGERLDPDAIEAAEVELGRVGAAALA
jgi:purine-nucleoside phosphorylase